MATNLFNFGPELDKILSNTNSLLEGQRSLLTALSVLESRVELLLGLKEEVDQIAEQVAALYSAAFGIPITIGIDLANVVTTKQPTPERSGP